MPFYETVFIARQDLSTAQVEELTENFSKIIKDNGGKVHKVESWGLRTLSYRINKNRKGHYVLIETDTPPAALHEMERNIRLNEDVLRYLTVREEKLSTGPSAPLRGHSDDDDRGPRDRDSRDRDSRDRDSRDRDSKEKEAA
jgi:small subunit ribosomal protein S6